MKHVHIDKAIGGTNDGRVTPYLGGQPVLSLIKKCRPEPVLDWTDGLIRSSRSFEVEHYRLETFCADGIDITFWLEEHLSPAAAICQLLLRYVPREDLAEVQR